MRELQPARPVSHQRTAALTVTPSMMAVAAVASAGGLALSPLIFVADGDVGTATEHEAVEKRDSHGGLAALNVGQILALVLVAIGTAGLLGVPGPDQAAVGYDLAVLGFALSIAVLIWNVHK